jgi:NTP pyrophosphatase (non-canonical NTP hydrolase)
MVERQTSQSRTVADVERKRQDEKWGEQNHGDLYWLGILMEEVGELAQAVIEGKRLERNAELIPVAAVAVAWRECLDRRVDGVGDGNARG